MPVQVLCRALTYVLSVPSTLPSVYLLPLSMPYRCLENQAEEASGEKRAEEPVLEEKSKPEEEERKGSPTLQAPSNPEKSPPGHNAQEGDIHARKNDMSSSDRAKSFRARRRRSCRVRRPADGRGPGRRDPEAVAKAEAAAKLAAAEAHRVGVDPTWQLPTNVDYYADRGQGFVSQTKQERSLRRLTVLHGTMILRKVSS